MATFTHEDCNFIGHVDAWAQENNKYVEKQFERLYPNDVTNGWEEVMEKYPSCFARAYALALEYQEASKDFVY